MKILMPNGQKQLKISNQSHHSLCKHHCLILHYLFLFQFYFSPSEILVVLFCFVFLNQVSLSESWYRFCVFASREQWLMVKEQERISGKIACRGSVMYFFCTQPFDYSCFCNEYNKAENPINNPPGAVMMVIVHCWGELTLGFSQAGGYCTY